MNCLSCVLVICLYCVPGLTAAQNSTKVPIGRSITIHIQNNSMQTVNGQTTTPLSGKDIHHYVASRWAATFNHPFKMILAGLFMTTVTVCSVYLCIHWYLKRFDTWSCWKSSLSLEVLRQIALPDLINEILSDAFGTEQQPWQSLYGVLNDINQAYKAYSILAKAENWRIGFGLNHLVKLFDNSLSVQNKLERLQFLHERITTYLNQSFANLIAS